MKQEDLELLKTDLCERFPHQIYARLNDEDMRIIDINYSRGDIAFTLVGETKTYLGVEADRIRPYLRPMSTMTQEEKEEYRSTFDTFENEFGLKVTFPSQKSFDWLNKKHFDSRGLIDLGLALQAPDWMYN